jgi:hypothetical protein
MSSRSWLNTALVTALVLATLGGCIVGEPDEPEVDSLAAGGGIGIKDGRLVRGTTRWRPRGVTLTGLALSPAAAAAKPGTVYARAYREVVDHLDTQLARYASWGVDTLRFQVSQDALDPQSPVHDPAYLPFVMDALKRARTAGFAVIVSMRESMPGDFKDPCGPDKLPCDITRRAWRAILMDPTDIGHDRRFMLEIYNEPLSGVQNTEANWAIWKPPHQKLLDQIRAMGAKNVVIADGIRAGKFMPLAGKYRLADPLGNTAYGIHPYPLLLPNLAYYRTRDWQPAFGDFCDNGNACIATEWASGTDVACFDKTNNPNGVTSPSVAAALLRYLDEHHIGSAVWPADYPGAIVSDWAGTLTAWGTQSTFSCSDTSEHRGMGHMVRAYYLNGTLP